MTTLPQVTLEILAGEDLDKTIAVLDGAGAPVPAASIVSARAQVRVRAGSTEVLHEWSTTAGNAQITSGGIRLTATAAETLAWQTDWPTSIPRWDIVVVDTAGVQSRLCEPSHLLLRAVLTRP